MLLQHVQGQSTKEGARYLKGKYFFQGKPKKYVGTANSIQQGEFQVWKIIFSQLFGLHKMGKKSLDQKREHVHNMLSSLASDWMQYSTKDPILTPYL